MFPPEAFLPFLTALNDRGITPIIVGGQAVNIWAMHFQNWERGAQALYPLKDYLPCLSSDLDVIDVIYAELKDLPNIVAKTEIREEHRSLSADVGTLLLRYEEGPTLRVQVMRRILGADNQEISDRAISIEVCGAKVKVPDPLLLLKCKLRNIRAIPHQESRNDLSHVKMLTGCIQGYIGEDLENGVDSRAILSMLKRFQGIFTSHDARVVSREHGIDLRGCLPLAQLRKRGETDEKIRAFLTYQIDTQRFFL